MATRSAALLCTRHTLPGAFTLGSLLWGFQGPPPKPEVPQLKA